MVQNAAPPERQSTAALQTCPMCRACSAPMQCLLFIYSSVVVVQISALSLSSIRLVFSVNLLDLPLRLQVFIG